MVVQGNAAAHGGAEGRAACGAEEEGSSASHQGARDHAFIPVSVHTFHQTQGWTMADRDDDDDDDADQVIAVLHGDVIIEDNCVDIQLGRCCRAPSRRMPLTSLRMPLAEMECVTYMDSEWPEEAGAFAKSGNDLVLSCHALRDRSLVLFEQNGCRHVLRLATSARAHNLQIALVEALKSRIASMPTTTSVSQGAAVLSEATSPQSENERRMASAKKSWKKLVYEHCKTGFSSD
ncbi:hypothetical protein AB1Y20_018526 [Prymnesium parvum]|uniref:Uncharacterized protein n=1 Tax=Prymnesium parvum TaxID=97485 RepID=A0AB34JNX4_PRYPA